MVTLKELHDMIKKTIDAQKRMNKASFARWSLPPGSSRARVTTANANHANACERYDRFREQLMTLLERAKGEGLDYHLLHDDGRWIK